jgi:hypothetical protein
VLSDAEASPITNRQSARFAIADCRFQIGEERKVQKQMVKATFLPLQD